MSDAALGLNSSMTPRLVKPKIHRVRQFGIPGLGRIALTRDPGEASLFSEFFLRTRLSAIVRDPAGRVLEAHDLGSGLVTNVGVLALAQDFGVPGVSTNAANLFANLKWHAWGTGTTAAATTDIKLQTLGKPNETNATSGVNVLVANGEGKPKLKSTATITASSSLAITEWGIHTREALSGTTGTPLTAKTATSGTTGGGLTASSATALGETLKILEYATNAASEAKPGWGLITSNPASVVTVPAWYLQTSGAVQEPLATSAYTLKPVMFDHRVFAAINVESGNTIEFPWELEVKSGG